MTQRIYLIQLGNTLGRDPVYWSGLVQRRWIELHRSQIIFKFTMAAMMALSESADIFKGTVLYAFGMHVDVRCAANSK